MPADLGVEQARRRPARRDWPLRHTVPVIAACFAVSVTLFVIAYDNAEHSTTRTHFTVFWLGMAIALVGVVVGGLSSGASKHVPPLILLAFGLLTYVPKFLMSRNGPAYFDEYAHVRHAQDILHTGNIGSGNSFLPVISYYPGLGILTAGLHFVTGLGVWHSGQVLIVAAHCGALLLVYALGRSVDLEARAAFFGAVVFAANPGYLYFDSQYAYESLAMPMVIGAALCTVRARRAATVQSSWRWAAGAAAVATATVFTHHISAVVMVGIVVMVAVFTPGRTAAPADGPGAERTQTDRVQRAQRLSAAAAAAWAVVFASVWILAVSTQTRHYLAPSVTQGVDQLVQRVTGSSPKPVPSGSGSQITVGATNHALFAGTSVPRYESLSAYAVVVVVALMFVWTAWRLWGAGERWAQLRLAAPWGLLTIAYLASLPLALTTSGNQASHRSWPFFYIGVAILSAWVAGRPDLRRVGARRARSAPLSRPGVAAVALFAVLMVANVGNGTAGTNVIYRFPGPYVFGQDNRFKTAELDAVVNWCRRNLDKNAHFVSDRYTSQALYVGTRMVAPTSTQSAVFNLFRAGDEPDPKLRAYLRQHHFRYFVLDTRIVNTLPAATNYFQAYAGDSSINRIKLAQIAAVGYKGNSFMTLLHSSDHYRVYAIHP